MSGPVPRGDPCLHGQRKPLSQGQIGRRCSCRGVCSGTRAPDESDHRVRHVVRPVRGTVGGRRSPLAGGQACGGGGGGSTRMGSVELPAPAAGSLATLSRARRDTRRSECQFPRLSSSCQSRPPPRCATVPRPLPVRASHGRSSPPGPTPPTPPSAAVTPSPGSATSSGGSRHGVGVCAASASLVPLWRESSWPRAP